MSLRYQMRYMNPYDLHKILINEYVLKKPGDTKKLCTRDHSTDKNDYDVIRENHRFLWNDDANTWEEQFAKKYYDKLFKEYCIGDLSLYRENKVALRWRTEKEVVCGKGQFICGNKKCSEEQNLKTWEVNFAYHEHGERKNALVKIRLCPNCSDKLNYHSKKREVKRLNKKAHHKIKHKDVKNSETVTEGANSESDGKCTNDSQQGPSGNDDTSPWGHHKPIENKSRDEEMEEYLEELLL